VAGLKRSDAILPGKNAEPDQHETGWKYPRSWEEAQVRSEREILQVEDLRRVNIEGHREAQSRSHP
jgi:hypothetical protein